MIKYRDWKNWEVKENDKPVIICIYGAYIEQDVLGKEIVSDDHYADWATPHFDDHYARGYGLEHEKSSKSRMEMAGELTATHKVLLKSQIKLRDEPQGLTLFDGRKNVFFVNSVGKKLIKYLPKEGRTAAQASNDLNVMEETVLDFYRKLLICGLAIAEQR